jgi:hypothetical protein
MPNKVVKAKKDSLIGMSQEEAKCFSPSSRVQICALGLNRGKIEAGDKQSWLPGKKELCLLSQNVYSSVLS